MDFTREPVIESVITPREGCKLVVRSSKGTAQEEYFVDAVEVVSFGGAFFFRSLEKPKCFLLPVVDYEILEAREARMVLKAVGVERSIKIAPKETEDKKEAKEEPSEARVEKKRERKKHLRRRRRDEPETEKVEIPKPREDIGNIDSPAEERQSASSIIRSLMSPPPLISETIEQYRQTYSQAFFEPKGDLKEDEIIEEESSEQEKKEDEETPVEQRSPDDLWNFSQ